MRGVSLHSLHFLLFSLVGVYEGSIPSFLSYAMPRISISV